MQKMKIEKRITDEVSGLRKLAGLLPAGKARALLNKCDRLEKLGRKAQALADAPVGELFARPVHADYDARTQDDIAAQMRYKKAVYEAMLSGRKVSLKDAAEFRISQMHTAIAQIRSDITRRHPDQVLCDEWVRPEGGRPFKQYWITKIESK